MGCSEVATLSSPFASASIACKEYTLFSVKMQEMCNICYEIKIHMYIYV
jgi:hypothetical protein